MRLVFIELVGMGILRTLLLIIAIIAMTSPSLLRFEVEGADRHLQEYAEYNVSAHHDNIDEEYPTHSHIHKHSEDGEEHKHDHEHESVTQVEIKVLRDTDAFKLDLEKGSLPPLFNMQLVSNPHPSGIFRPPRS